MKIQESVLDRNSEAKSEDRFMSGIGSAAVAEPRQAGSNATQDEAWGDKSVSIVLGCPNRCRYCFAKAKAKGYGRIGGYDQWGTTYHRLGAVDLQKGWGNYGTVRFPNTHDITPEFLEECVTVLRNLRVAGNRLIICSKPRLECTRRLCSGFADHEANIEFRFTITAMDDSILGFWEPGAPCFEERRTCLEYAFNRGFQTSVNIEPMLDVPNVVELFENVVPDVNVIVNLGVMHCIRRNVAPQSPREIAEVERIEGEQSAENVRRIHEALKDHPLVRWSPSTRKLLGLGEATECR